MKNCMVIIVVLLSFSCKKTDKMQKSAADTEFDKISEDFLTGYLKWRPQNAVYLGFHEYNKELGDLSKASLTNELGRLKEFDQKLAGMDSSLLSPDKFYDWKILRSAIKNEIFGFEDLRYYTKDPISYAIAFSVSIHIKRNYAPLEERLQTITFLENQAPKLFEDARINLEDSLPLPFIQTAISIALGSASFLEKDLILALKEVKNDSLMSAFHIANQKAIDALKNYAAYLEKEKLPKANNDIAIGEENYRKMLLYSEGITLSPDSLLAIGMKELKKEQEAFNAAAKIISPDKKPLEIFEEIQKEHSDARNLIPDAAKKVESIRQFLIDHDIITLPSEVRVKVQETPAYARATSSASMDTPGPFETKATEAYYYITPVDSQWSAKHLEDWLRQFNYYSMDITSIHEAYPGHYVQFLHLNSSDASKIRKIFGSYAFIEGWAHYTEKMMLDAGFGKSTDTIRTAKYRLAQSGDALLRLCRLCVSVKMHCHGMTVEEATKFFMDNWYQGEKPSSQEALRGTYDPGYLFYTLGKLQVLKLQEDYKNQEGKNYSLKKFNDAMVDHGMPPVQIMREILLKDKKLWFDIL